MGLPDDIAGSISKNRFRIELLCGISKMIDRFTSSGRSVLAFFRRSWKFKKVLE